jgi:leucyl aminopeptidase
VVTELVKKLVGSGAKESCVVLALKDPAAEAFAACCAIPRAFSLFSMKSGAPAAPPRVRVLTGTAPGQPLLADRALGRGVALGELAAVAAGIQECARLVDMPPNVLNVNDYVARARELGAQLGGVEVLVIQGESLRTMGMGGLYGVGQASAQPAALVVLSHKGRDAAAKSVCFVGKSIVYDTGGLSIKVPPNMAGMKHDMASLFFSGRLGQDECGC